MGKTVQQKSEGPEGKVVGDEGEMKDYEGFMCRGIRITHKFVKQSIFLKKPIE